MLRTRSRFGICLSAVTVVLALPSVAFPGCASTGSAPVKKQAYAKLPNQRTFEYDRARVWEAIEKVAREMPLPVAKTETVSGREQALETEWINDESREKYHEYKINGSPRRKKLQVRLKHRIIATSVMGGTEVRVKTQEEIEKLNKDGTSQGFSQVSDKEVDTSRASEILDKINQAILNGS